MADAASIARKFVALADGVEKQQHSSVDAVALHTTKILRSRIAAASGGDNVLSGTTRTTRRQKRKGNESKGKKLGVGYDLAPSGRQALIAARGPLPLIEVDQAPHVVVSRWATGAEYQRHTKAGRVIAGKSTIGSRQASVLTGNGAAGGGRRAVLNQGGGVFRRWTISSSKGKHPWEFGIKEASPAVGRIHAKATHETIAAALRR